VERWTVVSNYLKRLILERDINIADQIEVIPMPNDESIFYPDQNIAEVPNLIVAVSRLTVQKRIDFLIEAFKLAVVEYPDLKLEIYGTGPEESKLRRIIETANLADRIHIKEPIPQSDLRQVYNKAAIVILNSVDEGFGLSLSEAMLCRRSVIGTESGGIVDIIDDNESGLLVPPDDSPALADAIIKLVKNPDLRNRLASAGYEKAIENYSSKSSAEKFARMFGDS
jgi:glycosyltransferase involved in cell wall biosynthesis